MFFIHVQKHMGQPKLELIPYTQKVTKVIVQHADLIVRRNMRIPAYAARWGNYLSIL